MEEEKWEEIQGGKRRRGLIKRKRGSGDQSKGDLDKRGHWKKKKEVFGKEKRVFRGSRSSRLLGLVFCLMMIDDDDFALRIGSVSDDDDGFWKRKRGEESQKINLEGGS